MASRSQNRVRAAREALGMSQVALAAAARLSRQSIGSIESGRATPAVDVALRLAHALERSVEDLFGVSSAATPLLTEPTAAVSSGRLAVAEVGGRWLS
jgi:putative molybdopterin biosynthesis protein